MVLCQKVDKHRRVLKRAEVSPVCGVVVCDGMMMQHEHTNLLIRAWDRAETIVNLVDLLWADVPVLNLV
jgi:hypothetical protein